jgi:hypothetical protein
MPTDQERRLEEILGAARDLRPLALAAFLDQACEGKAELLPRAEY